MNYLQVNIFLWNVKLWVVKAPVNYTLLLQTEYKRWGKGVGDIQYNTCFLTGTPLSIAYQSSVTLQVHYFVMTAKKESLLREGVLKEDIHDDQEDPSSRGR